MRHARPDYQGRIVDLQQRIPSGEPVFLLRAQDITAPGLVALWADQLASRGGDPRLVAMAHEQARRMLMWQRAHGSKLPDLPADVLETKSGTMPDGRKVDDQ